jgi:DNA-binding transcriptional MerR regulator
MAIDGMHQIGEVAEAVGLSLRTIRHYEEVGVAPPSGRSAGGFRLYTDDDIERLRLAKALKPLDLTLDEMRDLLDTRDQLADPATKGRTRADLVEHLAMYATLAQERCNILEDQLASVREVARTLQTESVVPKK